MADGPLKRMVKEMPRIVFHVLQSHFGSIAKEELETWWPNSMYGAQWSMSITGGSCVVAAMNDDTDLLTRIWVKELIVFKGKKVSGGVIAQDIMVD